MRAWFARGSAARRIAIGAATAALLALTLILIVVASNTIRDSAESNVAAFEPEPESIAQPAPRSTITPSVRQTRTLGAITGSHAWLAETGDCAQGPVSASVTFDGGASFEASDLGSSGVGRVVAVDTRDAGALSALVLDGSCALAGAVSYTEGRFWALDNTQALGSFSYLIPESPGLIATPGGVVATPCTTTVSLAIHGDGTGGVGVVCSTHFVHRSQNGGGTWDPGVLIDGAASITATGTGYTVGSFGDEVCGGVALTPISLRADGTAPAVTGCFPGEFAADRLALGYAGGNLWIWAGDSVRTSPDNGASWPAPGAAPAPEPQQEFTVEEAPVVAPAPPAPTPEPTPEETQTPEQ